jgi:hypothetical protein
MTGNTPAVSSLPVLRIAVGILVDVDLNILYATLPSRRFRSPALVQQLYRGEFVQRQTAPDS